MMLIGAVMAKPKNIHMAIEVVIHILLAMKAAAGVNVLDKPIPVTIVVDDVIKIVTNGKSTIGLLTSADNGHVEKK